MQISQIHITSRGPLVKGTGANFPKLADLEPFIDLKPLGFAANAVAAISSVRTMGRAA